MRRLVTWNLSSRARQLAGGDAIVVSIPKSGRTWVRTFLCAYFCEKIGQPFTLEPEKYDGVPQIIYTHDLFEQRTKADRWDKLRGKYLIPQRDRTGRPIILLVRDPRDAFVSLYIQLTRRTRETPAKLKQMSASELLRDPAFGIESMVEIMNSWLAEWSDRVGLSPSALRRIAERPRAGVSSTFAGPRRTALGGKGFFPRARVLRFPAHEETRRRGSVCFENSACRGYERSGILQGSPGKDWRVRRLPFP